MQESAILRSFGDRLFYAAHFMDAALWGPFAQRVCQEHSFDCRKVNPGLAGTFPTFIVESEMRGVMQPSGFVVVKFFGSPFNGTEAYKVERSLGYWLANHPLPVPSPAILAEGQLEPDWWYLIFEYIPGISIGKVREQLALDEWVNLAQKMGVFMHALHSMSVPVLPDQPCTMMPTWDGYSRFLHQQYQRCLANHQEWNDLPGHLLSQLESYIIPVEQLADYSHPPHLIHADLTADHVLGRIVNGRWQTLAIIDWGDAMTGDILYEILALYLDLFRGEKQLLKLCLDAYGLPDFYRQDFARKSLSIVLLYPYPLPPWIIVPQSDSRSMPELAERLFGF